jgi:hypothetical protein
MSDPLRRIPRLPALIAGFRRWLTYRPERAYMRGR